MDCAAWVKFLTDFGVCPKLLPREHAVLVFSMGANKSLAPVLVRSSTAAARDRSWSGAAAGGAGGGADTPEGDPPVGRSPNTLEH